MACPPGFTSEPLSNTGLSIYRGSLPAPWVPSSEAFEALWEMRPPQKPFVHLREYSGFAPRWHKAYGEDYAFAGLVARAEPVPEVLAPLLAWTRANIDPRFNGILVNWYDAALRHKIGRHRDSPIRRLKGCPIVTISLGATRLFEMHVRRKALGFLVENGDVIVIPDETNAKYAHAVPHREEDVGRRISVTVRGFSDDPALVLALPEDEPSGARDGAPEAE
jgi:alkylated DNA repair dioxygenase AlkB